jgi:hypothetical protein
VERAPYTVRVAENSHYLDESEAYDQGTYPTLEAAEAACRKIVDDFLAANRTPDMNAEELFKRYATFGEDPYVIGSGAEASRFSAWDYARRRCTELVGG